MVKVKHGVTIGTLNKEINEALIVISYIYRFLGHILTVTSTNDSTHKVDSKHYENDAFDCRIDDLDGLWDGIISERCLELANVIVNFAKVLLGKNFDIILEKNHIHVEWDPKL